MYKERRKNIDEILQKLSSKLDASNNIFQIEYAYVGIKDESCYDFRKEVERSSKCTQRKKSMWKSDSLC